MAEQEICRHRVTLTSDLLGVKVLCIWQLV